VDVYINDSKFFIENRIKQSTYNNTIRYIAAEGYVVGKNALRDGFGSN
jgi:hypothetical protein